MRPFQGAIWKSSEKFAYPKPRELAIVQVVCRVTKGEILHTVASLSWAVRYPNNNTKVNIPIYMTQGFYNPHPELSKIVHIAHEIIITGILPLVLGVIPIVPKIIVIIIIVVIFPFLFLQSRFQ